MWGTIGCGGVTLGVEGMVEVAVGGLEPVFAFLGRAAEFAVLYALFSSGPQRCDIWGA